MATRTKPNPKTESATPLLFERIVVGVDRSPESVEAARQAAILAEPGTAPSLVGVWTVPAPATAAVGVTASPELNAGFYRKAAEEAVAAATHAIEPLAHPATTKIVRGRSWEELLAEAEAEEATLLAVGSHGQGRMRGIVIGSTATELVHEARCSVLVAREADARFPRRIVVGVDGSAESAAAFAVAHRLAERFGSKLWPVVARNGKDVDRAAVESIVGYHYDELRDDAVSALLAAGADADLVVVGSRGLHGLKALGSVSERVAHRAHCSTLIVRTTDNEL